VTKFGIRHPTKNKKEEKSFSADVDKKEKSLLVQMQQP